MTNELLQVGDRIYVEATVKLFDLESGEMIENKAQAREEEIKKGMDAMQITGTSSSYARKYALAGMFCIDNEQDSDATSKKSKDFDPEYDAMMEALDEQNKKEVGKQTIDEVKIQTIKNLEKEGIDLSVLYGMLHIKDASEMTEKQYQNIVTHLDDVKAQCGRESK
jgi:galactose-1-phosphate uridylyltransferase